MDRLRMQTPDGVQRNIDRLAALFPECVTECEDRAAGGVRRGIDFGKLRQLLSADLADEGDTCYQFTWPDKRKAVLLAGAPVTAALRPVREESVDFDTTRNLYIEGDNLDVLKLLKETYLHKVKMIYIDPPYNTGNDFVYADDFSQSAEDYRAQSGQYDEQGRRLFANAESNGRFHTDWLNMIYPRLKVARDLLADDGVIFISIDDHEVANLKKVCDEVFGEGNCVGNVVWQRTYAPISLKKFYSESHDYCLTYARNIVNLKFNLLPRSEKQNKDYKNPDNDPRGVWKVGNLTVGPAVQKQIYEIVGPTGRKFLPPSGYCWRFTKEKFEQMRADKRIWFGADGGNSPVPKLFLSEVQNGVTPMTLWTFEEAGHSQEATREFRDLMGASVFTSPKPLRYVKRFLHIGSDPDSLILDFFSGSATTAHAVMQLNAEDGGHRRYICVQLPEETAADSEAHKAGYKNICEIGKERIRRAGAKIKADNPLHTQTLDTGFRVLRLDSSNMQDVYYSPAETEQQDLWAQVDNVKSDRTAEDLLFQVMLELGATLDSRIERQEVAGKTVWNVAGGYLVACFDQDVTDEVVTAIARQQPQYAVLRDTSLRDDQTATNFEQLLRTYAPGTITKIL